MKKVIITLLAITSLCTMNSCYPEAQKASQFVDGTTFQPTHFEYKGHAYVGFSSYSTGYTGFEHDPMCLKKDINKANKEALKEVVREIFQKYMLEHNK